MGVGSTNTDDFRYPLSSPFISCTIAEKEIGRGSTMKTTVKVEEAVERIGYMNFLVDKLNSLCDTAKKLEKKYDVFICREELKLGKEIMGRISRLSITISQTADNAAQKGKGLSLLMEQVNKNISLIYEALRHIENAIDFDRKDSEFGLMISGRCYPEGEQEKEKHLYAFHMRRYEMIGNIGEMLDTEAPILFHIRLRHPGKAATRQALFWTNNASLRPKEEVVPLTIETAGSDIIPVYGEFCLTGKMETETLIRTLTAEEATIFVAMWGDRLDTIKRNKS